jgi:oligopeptide/dipeptide ABC transporter ATP-binding protein
MQDCLLEVKGLKSSFFTSQGIVPAVDGLDFSIARGETLGVVGESGCGKSVTSLSIMGLLPAPQGRTVAGKVLFNGEDLLAKPENEMRDIRGNRISMIFQEPMTSLNPVYTIGNQIAEALVEHRDLDRREARHQTVELLRLVGIPLPEHRCREYPHQLSGGMRQRAMIAMAIACNPSLLIADEPTTALDVTIQAQILELLKSLQSRLNMAIILITHDLGVVAEMAHKVLVMYAGKTVEYADVETLFSTPRHPYTVGLFKSVPDIAESREDLEPLEGTVPNPYRLPEGCRFHPRCPHARPLCREREPELYEVGEQKVRCFRFSAFWEESEAEHAG